MDEEAELKPSQRSKYFLLGCRMEMHATLPCCTGPGKSLVSRVFSPPADGSVFDPQCLPHVGNLEQTPLCFDSIVV